MTAVQSAELSGWKTSTGGSTSHHKMQQLLARLVGYKTQPLNWLAMLNLSLLKRSIQASSSTTDHFSPLRRWHWRLVLAPSSLNAWTDLCRSAEPTLTVAGITNVTKLYTDNVVWLRLLPEVVNLLRLFLTVPVTSCTADRSFSWGDWKLFLVLV